MQNEPPFESVAIVGLGLIGGSIALATRERWPSTRVMGIDAPSVLAHALGSGAIDRAIENVEALPQAELVILAAPVQQNIALLQQLPVRSGAIITDVGGTKRSIVEAARGLPAAATFVGGHPLAGGERGGFAFARPDLFSGRPWIFTPDGAAGQDAVPRLVRFAAGLGARTATMTAEQHDRLMAYVSHLPQLAASALMEVAGAAATAEGLRVAGKGLLDTTRLASSPSDIWQDICATNADAIGEALDHLIERLTELRADLQRGEAIEAIFAEAARWRAELIRSSR